MKARNLLLLASVGMLCAVSASCRGTRSNISEDGSRRFSTSGAFSDLISASNERKAGPVPESEWNEHGLWQKVADEPAVYIAAGYPSDSPRTEEVGDWFVDERDGKRLFVPDEAVGKCSPGILRGEATKITNWQLSYKKAFTDPSSTPAWF